MFGIASRLGIGPYISWARARLFPLPSQPLRVIVKRQSRGEAVFEAIRLRLDEHAVPCFFGGDETGDSCLHVRDTDVTRLHLALRSLDPAYGGVRFCSESLSGPLARLPDDLGDSYDLFVEEGSDWSVDPALTFESLIRVNIWRPHASYSTEELYDAGRPNRHYGRIRRPTLDTLVSGRQNLDLDPVRDIFQANFDVDLVYTWVNGEDREWRAKRDHRAASLGRREAMSAGRSTHEERYRSRDELLYSLRSIEQFAPFVRRIWLVTDGQVPTWLKPSDRLTVIDHKDIFRSAHMLPTFNSSAIETQLHHIEGLSEHFIYFNDDFFLGRPCTVTDFFTENGLLKYFPSNQRVNENDIDDGREEYLVADRNANLLFMHDFGFVGRLLMRHVPYPSSRSLLFDLEHRYQVEFDECASQPFRSIKDLRPIAFMQYPFSVSLGKAVMGDISHRYLPLWREDIERQLDIVRNARQWKTFCINDVGVSSERQRAIDNVVRGFLHAYFPAKSRYEV